MEFQRYPMALYLRGWDDLNAMVTVHSSEEEEAARADGYRHLAEDPAEEDDSVEAPKRRGRPPKVRAE